MPLLNAQNFILTHEYPHRDVCATYHLRHWWHRWGEMQQQVYQVHDVDELKQRLINVWHDFEQSVIDVIWAFNLTPYNAYFVLPIVLNKSYCVTCSRILPVSVFCVLQSSGVTALKCGEIYDMDFFYKFHGKYDSDKKLKLGQHLSNLWTNV